MAVMIWKSRLVVFPAQVPQRRGSGSARGTVEHDKVLIGANG